MRYTIMQRSGCLRFVSLVACSSFMVTYPLAGQARGLAEIEKTKELRVCIAFVSPAVGKAEPTGCRDDCKVSGDTPDLARAFASALGPNINPKWMSVTWEEQFSNRDGKVVQEASYTPELLASGTCDLFATNIAKVSWRTTKLDYVLLNSSRMTVVVSKPKSGTIKTPNDLAGKSVVTYKDTFYENWLLEQNQTTYKSNPVKIRYVADEEQSLKEVNEARADFTLMITDTWLPLAQKFQNAAVAFGVGPTLEMGWAFRKDDKDLQAAAQRFFEAQRAAQDSLMNQQFLDAYHMTIDQYEEYVGSLK